MEKNLEKHLEDTLSTPNVVGVLCADKEGLCLGTKGTVNPNSSGIVASLSAQARKLHPEMEPPIVCVESENVNVLIKSDDEITMAIFKVKS